MLSLYCCYTQPIFAEEIDGLSQYLEVFRLTRIRNIYFFGSTHTCQGMSEFEKWQ